MLRFFNKINVQNYWEIIHELLPIIKNRRIPYMIALGILTSIIPIGSAWISKNIFDKLSQPPIHLNDELIILLLLQLGLILSTNVIGEIRNYISMINNREIGLEMEQVLFKLVLNIQGAKRFEQSDFYTDIDLARQGLERLPSVILQYFIMVITNTVSILGFVIVVYMISKEILLLILLLSVFKVIIILKINKKNYDIFSEVSAHQRKSSYIQSLILNPKSIAEIQLFDISNYLMAITREIRQHINSRFNLNDRVQLVWKFIINLITISANQFIFIFSVLLVSRNLITLGDMILFTQATAAINSSISSLVHIFGQLRETALYLDSVIKLRNTKSEIIELEPQTKVNSLQENITLTNLSFRYDDGQPWILQDVNLTIRKGEILAIVGSNGSGKSSLLKILARLYEPADGKILWDDIDIRYFKVKDYQARVSITNQDFVKYGFTLRENIVLGSQESSNTRLQKAIDGANISDFIDGLPNGLDTSMFRWLNADDNGTDASEGQWQRIAIARMIYKQADLYILDEPTAYIDAKSEHHILTYIRSLFRDKTIIIVSHNLNTIKYADRIAVLKDGNIKELGTHDELLEKKGVYFRIFEKELA